MMRRLIIAVALTWAGLCYLENRGATAAEAKDQKAKAAPPPKKGPPPPPKWIEAPLPQLTWVFPAGGQQGHTFEAIATGQNLVAPDTPLEANTVTFSGSGITGKVLDGKDPNKVRILITIAPDAELGERELRFRTAGGVSNSFRFIVGDLPEVNEIEPNSQPDKAQPLPPLPLLINGQILDNDRDYFRFKARAGQTLVFSIRAREIVPYIADAVPGWFDPCLTVWDSSGKEVAYADDFRFHPDPVLFFRVPKDDEYTLEIRDIIYRGRGDFIYRLAVGELPYITDIFPLGGRRGTTTAVHMRGVNLAEDTLRITLPRDAPNRIELHAERGGIVSNTVPFAVTDLKEMEEHEPNDSPAQAQRMDPPLVVNGRIQTASDEDHFVFPAKAGEKFLLEVQARRLGSPLDAVLTVFNAKGGQLAENDDWNDPLEALITHHADPHLVFTAPTAGDYIVRIKDVQGKGGDEYGYRLVITPLKPDFALQILPDNPRVAQGDTVAITVNCLRRDGFNADVQLAVRNLPEGFSASEAIIPAGQDQARLTITAPPDAPLTILSPVITGTAVFNHETLVRNAVTAQAMMQAFAYTHNVPTKQLNLAIVKPCGFRLSSELATGKVLEVAPGSETPIMVKIHREENAKAGVALSAARMAPGINVRSAFVAADKDEAALTLVVAKDAKSGLQQNVVISGVMKTGRETIIRYLPAIPIRIR